MTEVTARLDRWIHSGPFTAVDLGVYRIVYAIYVLLTVRSFRWVSAYPDSLFDPPPGPFALLHGFPPEDFMIAVEIVLSVALAALAVGYRTTLASVVVAALLLLGSGFSYSLGKIDHNIFTVLVPLVLLFARWGERSSIDALRRRRSAAPREAPAPRPTPQWPLRLLALLTGLGFLTAAVPKIASGWLDPRSQAVQAVLGRQYYLNDRTDLLAPYLVHLDLPVAWELFDVSAVLLEVAVLCAVPWWRAFRVVLASATLFHLGVLLIMNIPFGGNVVVYGAFVSWSTVLVRARSSRRLEPVSSRVSRVRSAVAGGPHVDAWALVVAVVLGAGAWAIRRVVDLSFLSPVLVVIGAAVGGWYLLHQVWGSSPWSQRRRLAAAER